MQTHPLPPTTKNVPTKGEGEEEKPIHVKRIKIRNFLPPPPPSLSLLFLYFGYITFHHTSHECLFPSFALLYGLYHIEARQRVMIVYGCWAPISPDIRAEFSYSGSSLVIFNAIFPVMVFKFPCCCYSSLSK
jgi:hypothetical protein